MNKRRRKKRNKIINERLSYFQQHIFVGGRQNGKTSLLTHIKKITLDKKYKPFKLFKRAFDKMRFAIDFSSGKDFSVMTTAKINKGIMTIVKTKVI